MARENFEQSGLVGPIRWVSRVGCEIELRIVVCWLDFSASFSPC